MLMSQAVLEGFCLLFNLSLVFLMSESSCGENLRKHSVVK